MLIKLQGRRKRLANVLTAMESPPYAPEIKAEKFEKLQRKLLTEKLLAEKLAEERPD